MRDSVTVHMNATPEEIWALVSDVTRIGEFSPETFEAEWTHGATGPEVGARFRGHVKRNGRGPTYWTPCTVTYCEPGKDFGFSVGTSSKVVNNWRYQLAAAEGGGTEVTESFQLENSLPLRLYWRMLGWTRGKTNIAGMTATLNAIKAQVEK